MRPANPLRALAVALLFPSVALAQAEGGTLSLGVGQQRILQIGNVSRVAIGDPEVADVKQVGPGGDLLVTGVGEGRTTLLAWRAGGARVSYLVAVRRQDPKELVSEVRALLGDREGIRLRVVGERIYLDGETLTPEDQRRVEQVVALYPAVKSFVRPSAGARRLSAEALTRALQKAGLRGAQAIALGGSLFLEGTVEAKEDLTRADLVVQATGEKAENLLAVGVKRMVLVQVEFVEVSYQDNKTVGIKLPLQLASTPGTGAIVNVVKPLPSLGDTGTRPAASLSATLATGADFSLGARFDTGFVRVLSQPRLLCASGEKAEFNAGGEVPFLVVTQNQFAVEWKKFGILLRVTPTADRQGNIAADIAAEVSDLDRSLSVRANGFEVPGFRMREVKTNVTVKDGETVALSGLFNAGEDKEVSKFPLLGHIPILGELFKSRNFVERKTELAIYVTPRLVSPVSAEVRALIDDARKLYRDAAGSVRFSLFD